MRQTKPTLRQVRDHMAGLTALYRPANDERRGDMSEELHKLGLNALRDPMKIWAGLDLDGCPCTDNQREGELMDGSPYIRADVHDETARQRDLLLKAAKHAESMLSETGHRLRGAEWDTWHALRTAIAECEGKA